MKLPESLLNSLEGVAGFQAKDFVQAHMLVEAPVSIRLNPSKPAHLSFPFDGNVPWSTQGRYLQSRPSFITDPLWHAGAYYVQEASSMFLEHVIGQLVDTSKPLRVLDLCAAPGGKSTLLQSVISADSLLVCNEVVKQRLSILEENITRWGAANVFVTGSAPAELGKLEHFFDVVVTDVPCSGSGLFRKDPEALKEWSTQQVRQCNIRQQQILDEVLPSLKPGGLLIYATCSYSPEENEDIMEILSGKGFDSLPVPLDSSWNIVETLAASGAVGYRFYPYLIRGEGFFMAAFRKPESQRSQSYTADKIQPLPAEVMRQLKPFLSDRPLEIVQFKDKYLAFPPGVAGYLPRLQKHVYIRKAGVCLGSPSRNEWIPDPELAYSQLISATVPKLALNEADALQYLRGHTLSVPAGYKGWVLACYQSLHLGWMKVLPNRINNYYPKQWRIINK